MAHVSPLITYRCEFSASEYSLVTKALSGILKPEEMNDAIALGTKLLQQRSTHLETMLNVSRGAEEKNAERFGLNNPEQ